MMIYLQLFIQFFKTGLFALGGGLATIPFLYQISSNFHWFTKGDIVDMLAISESTPGAIGVNISTYAGFHTTGIFGALVSTFGLVLPSVIIILCVARALDKFKDHPVVVKCFYGIRAVVAGLICSAALSVFRVAFYHEPIKNISDYMQKIDFSSVILFAILYLASVVFEKKGKPIHPIGLIVFSGVVGILVMGV